jgi:hypothetical protein
VDDEHQLASLPDMRYKSCLSQNEHLLVSKCVLLLEACEDSLFQHVLVGDARASRTGHSVLQFGLVPRFL